MERKYLVTAVGAAAAVGGLFAYAARAPGTGGSDMEAGETAPAVAEASAASAAGAAIPLAAVGREMTVYKTPTCGCCGNWVDHVKGAGFETTVEDMPNVNPVKDRLGVPGALRSCHTAVVGDYVFEGHVPADLIERFLRDPPDGAAGLVVPGMPVGSPGMEMPGRSDRYDVLLLNRDGSTRVYASR